MRLGELRSSNPLRIPRPKIDKLACQAQGVGILAVGEITLRDAYCLHVCFLFAQLFYHTYRKLSRVFKKKIHPFCRVNLTMPYKCDIIY